MDSANGPVLLYKLLDEKLIHTFPDAKSKEEVVRRLADALGRAGKIASSEKCLARVMEREAGISTTLDTGLSLPHARLDGASGFVAGLALLPNGLLDHQQPDITIRAVLLFFSPNASEYFQKHLHFLRHVATLLQPELIDRLVRCRDSKEVLAALRAKES